MDPKTTIVPHPDYAGATHAANLADKHSSHRMRLESASTDAGEDLDKEKKQRISLLSAKDYKCSRSHIKLPRIYVFDSDQSVWHLPQNTKANINKLRIELIYTYYSWYSFDNDLKYTLNLYYVWLS